jgi:hypothetical protein
MKLKNIITQILVKEAKEKFPDPCSSLTEGKEFCKKLQTILSTGTGGKGAKKLQQLSFRIFRKLRNGDYFSMGDKITLEPGNKMFDERLQDMVQLSTLLKKHNSCSRIVREVDADTEKLKSKNMTMLVDDDKKYSLFNRINTHSSNQSFIITKLALDMSKQNGHMFYKLDTFSPDQIIEEVTEVLNQSDSLDTLDSLIGDLLKDQDVQKKLMDAFNFTRSRGYEVEDEGWNALRRAGYEVYPFSDDFGFIDYFGIDMVAVDEQGAHPVQVSASIKKYPKIFEYQADDCKVFALFKSGDRFVKYSPFS